MIHSVRFTCFLDTNVIYPVDVRDILLWFAHHELYTPKWSGHILRELSSVMKSRGIEESRIQDQINTITKAFPDALVVGYEPLLPVLELRDEKDKHVLAAAIKANAHVIVTNNLRDFPEDYLATFELVAKSADDFITDIIDLNQSLAVKAFNDLVANKTNPPRDHLEMLAIFRRRGLTNAANYLHSLI